MIYLLNSYQKLLLDGENEIKEFFQNYPIHPSQFKYNEINKKCYELMYVNNQQDDIKSVKELKESIPQLKEICKECASFYMKQRNTSIKGLDVQLGKKLEDILIAHLRKTYKFDVRHGDIHKKKYPDCMLLGTDKGILAYFEVKYHGAPFILAKNKIGRYCYEGSATLDLKKVITQIELIESELDRPAFYLHWIDYPCLKGIFFETSEQVKNELFKQGNAFERKEREGDYNKNTKKIGYTKKFYSKLLEMGSFDELIEIFTNMKKYGVRMS